MDVIYISKGTHGILMSIQNRVKVQGPGNGALESFCLCMPETKTGPITRWRTVVTTRTPKRGSP